MLTAKVFSRANETLSGHGKPTPAIILPTTVNEDKLLDTSH